MTVREAAGRGSGDPSDSGARTGTPPSPSKRNTFVPPCLSLDLEVGRKDRRIHAFAAVRPDTGRQLVFHGGDLPAALAKLDELATGAKFLLGHNLILFDLPHLAAAVPRSRTPQLARCRYTLAQSSRLSAQSRITTSSSTTNTGSSGGNGATTPSSTPDSRWTSSAIRCGPFAPPLPIFSSHGTG